MGNKRRAYPQHVSIYIELRKQLKTLRLDSGLTQVELGKDFKRPHTFVHKIESGDRRIDPVEFCKWCHACGVDPAKAIIPISNKTKKKKRTG